jgi:hypothetical protein
MKEQLTGYIETLKDSVKKSDGMVDDLDALQSLFNDMSGLAKRAYLALLIAEKEYARQPHGHDEFRKVREQAYAEGKTILFHEWCWEQAGKGEYE